jgi:hypothetical protein
VQRTAPASAQTQIGLTLAQMPDNEMVVIGQFSGGC